MSRLPIARAEAFEGPAVQYTGDDGYPASIILPVLVVEAVDGRWFQQPNRVSIRYDDEGFQYVATRFDLGTARAIAEKALEIGIEADCWVELEGGEEALEEYLRQPYILGGAA